ncbi:MAG: phosphoribosylamine--glycine ligase [Dehalococcoidales bacterium]|nr:phosphoribosylamine--glycine ligase [Dehalococcoidales bacterium]
MKVLIVGSGAREHTLAWKLSKSSRVSEIYAAPGNAGTAEIAENIDISYNDIKALAQVAIKKGIDLTVVGPEGPLANGIVDEFKANGLRVFGPNKAAAMIEASKVFAKDLLQKYGIPCARSAGFSSYAEAKDYLQKQKMSIVIKADGLAAGKGVTVAETMEQALTALSDIMQTRIFGDAGNKVIIEEKMTGKEMSTFAFADANTSFPMISACDYKTVYDGNKGPNTGGMGCYSPPYFLTPELSRRITREIMDPTFKAMIKEGAPYQGVLYGGLMITEEGPRVMEFNARFGDPETQVIIPRLKTDLLDIMLGVTENNLKDLKIEFTDDSCVGVVMASGGYPGIFKKGLPVSGLKDVDKDIMVFHAGTRLDSKGMVVTDGGRVLTIVALGKSIDEAREKVYNNISRIHFDGCHYRKDIALFDKNL